MAQTFRNRNGRKDISRSENYVALKYSFGFVKDKIISKLCLGKE